MPRSLIDTPRRVKVKVSPVHDIAPETSRDKLFGFFRPHHDTLFTSNVREVEIVDYVAPANLRDPYKVGSQKSHLPLKRDKTRYIIK